ncbi:hypothetical protein L1987_61086 [Smallanthus sonchifolius]|uniref:Uncharacterized protein n=1 Tax=Smallanthus sonchifolius TaxID=185202 RepID=A0ACB9D9T4_9ASTR|nr:hypothetical protein L1987_61086 [Smallanthus sonchifolius]
MEKSHKLKNKDDDLDDEEGGDDEKGNNESKEENDDDKEGDKEREDAKGQDAKGQVDKEGDDMDDDVVGEEEGGDEEGEEEDEVIDHEDVRDEVIVNKENEEVVLDENIPGEKEQEGDDDEEENIIFMRTWLMEHGGYKKEDTQEWGLVKLKEKMNKVEIEIAMYENIKLEETKKAEKKDNKKKEKKKGSSPRSIELRRKWRHRLFDANIGYTWPSINRMGDERLLKELNNLKKLVGVVANALDAFTELLNFEEQKRSLDSKFRLYGTCTMLPTVYYQPKFSDSERFNILSDNLEARLRALSIKSLKVVDLMIIPMLMSEHYYVSCFNLRDGAVDLLDNNQTNHRTSYKKSTEGKKEDPKRNLFHEIMERNAGTF